MVMTAFFYLSIMFVFTRWFSYKGQPVSSFFADYYSAKGGDTYKRYAEFDPAKEYEVWVLGSSHAYRGYDPRLFDERGIRMYNLGSSAQVLRDTDILLSHFLKKGKPKMLILDVYPGAFEEEGTESVSRLLPNFDSDVARDLMLAYGDWRGVNMYFNSVFNPNPPLTDLHEEANGTYIPGGYVEKKESPSGKFDFSKTGKEFLPHPKNVKGFEHILKTAQKSGIPLLLFCHPLPLETGRAEVAGMNQLIRDHLKSGMLYFDYSFDHPLDFSSHFYDYHHMNAAGVAWYNKSVIYEVRNILQPSER